MTQEQRYLRMRAVVLARQSGQTWAEIGKRHGISGTRAQQIYQEWTWPTDVVQRRNSEWARMYGEGAWLTK
jgi:hypothetical protein